MIRWNIDTELDLAVAAFFSLREELMGDGEADTDDDRQDEAGDAWLERQEELRIEQERQIDDDVRRAEADYLNPRN